MQPNTTSEGWCITNLKTPNAYESVELNESHNTIPDINKHVAAVLYRKVHLEKINELEESEAFNLRPVFMGYQNNEKQVLFKIMMPVFMR